MWATFFDKIFVISLINRKVDRLISALKQLKEFDIEAEVFEATYNEVGIIGLRDTMIRLFSQCIEKGYQNVLIFEDDISIIEDINLYMPLCLGQLPKDYNIFYLGAYVVNPFKNRYSENLLELDVALTTHAVAYPRKTMDKMLTIFNRQSENPNDKTPIDIPLLNNVIKEGKSYISYPLLVSQKSGYSDIMKKEINYDKYIEVGYSEQYKKLLG